MTKVLYLDYDGVLHDDAVYWHPKHGIYMGTQNRVLFEWTSILEELLAPYRGRAEIRIKNVHNTKSNKILS